VVSIAGAGFGKDKVATMWSTVERTSPSKETTMPARRFERTILAQLLVSGCAMGAYVMVAHAQAQYIPPPTPLPPPVFNPSTPYTVPQPPYRPIAPSTPSAARGYVVTEPVIGHLRRTAARSQQRTAAAARPPAHHRRHVVVVRARPVRTKPLAYSSYYAAFGYGYGCAWQRSWDGYWFRTSPCS
jgi:hypothetical protein